MPPPLSSQEYQNKTKEIQKQLTQQIQNRLEGQMQSRLQEKLEKFKESFKESYRKEFEVHKSEKTDVLKLQKELEQVNEERNSLVDHGFANFLSMDQLILVNI